VIVERKLQLGEEVGAVMGERVGGVGSEIGSFQKLMRMYWDGGWKRLLSRVM
jgi:hypothetical protein